MAAGLISATATALIAAILNGANYTAPTNLYIQLHVGNPGAAGSSNISAGSTTRVAVTYGTASAGSATQNGSAPSWTNGGTSETLSYITIWTASTGGTCLWSIALSTTQAWAVGNTFTLTTSTLSLGPVAS